MSGSAKAGTTAERHTCEAAGSDRLNSARSSEARVRRIFFSLDKDLHGCLQMVQGVRYAVPLVGIPLLHCASQCLFHDSLCLFDLGEALLWIGFLQHRPIQLDPVKISHKNSLSQQAF